MAISYKKQYTSEAEYMYDLAKSSELYRDDTYNFAVANNQDEDYAYALAGTKTKESDTFDLIEYDLLSGEDQYMYLLNEYYVDKTETAKDEDTGETYNVYKRNREYLDYKIEEVIDRQTYESLSGFEKFLHTIGGIIGNAFNELFLGTIEGLVDLGAVIVGQKDWAATDFTGVQANRESLQRYARAYTYIDKSGFWKGVNDVATGITKMAPLLIPGAGKAIYFGAMAGNTAEEAIRANPDIDYGSLLLYTAGTTTVEFATEKISGFLFGTGKLVGGAKSANFLTRFGLDFLSEGFEEGVAEIAGSILYQQFVDPNAPIASFKDVMYASLIGGLIGGIATTGRIAGTRSKTILKDGTVVDTKVAKAQGFEGKKLSKTKSLYLQEQISDIKDAQETSELTKLQAKYSGESLQQIQESHAEEYQQAVQQDAELQEKMIESSLGLTKILEMAGVEGFTKAADLLNYTTEQKARLINNFVSTATGVSAENRAVEEKFKQTNGGISSFTITDTLNATQQTLKNKIKQLYGKNVYFGNLGEQDGVFRRHGLTLDENTIIIDINIEQEMSVDKIINKVVKEELVHTLQFESGILDAKTLHDLMEQYKKLGGASQQIELDAAYRTSSDLTKISETQAQTLAQTLLFDKFTVSRIFSTNRTLFNKIYNWARNIKEGIENLKNRKTNSDKVKYRQLLKIMKRYRDSVAENIGNTEDAQQAISEMRLTDEQIQELYDTYLPDATNEHFTLLKAEYTIHTQQRMAAEKLLLKARNPIMSLTDTLDFKYIFDTNYWGTIDDGKGNKINFVEAIMSRDPSKDFRRNLQEYMIEVTGFAINQKEGCLMEVLDYNTVTTNDFDQTMAELQTNPDALSKYTRLSDIFNEEFNRKFVTIDGVNDLEDVDLRFVTRDTDENLQAKYEGINLQTQKPTITVYLRAGQQWNIKQIDNLKHKLFHEVTHALADIQGLPNGTSYNYVRTALQELDRQQINRLGKLLLTDEFYNENKNNLNILMDNIAYGIYRITDGEYAAEAYAQSLTRKGDMKVNLKAGATMNRSGFRTDGLFIEGYGRFKGISLYSSTVVQAKQNYKLSALRSAVEVVAFSIRNDLANHLKSMGIDDYQKAGFSENFIRILNNPNSKMSQIWEAIIKNEVGNNNATNAIYRFVTSKQQLKDTYLRRIQNNNERIKELEGKTDDVSKKKLEKLEETKRNNKQRFEEINAINVADNESVNKNMVTTSDVTMATSYGIAMARLVWYVVKRTNTSERLDEPKLSLKDISSILGKPVEYKTPLTFDELSKILNNSDPAIAKKLDVMLSQTATLLDEEKNTNIIKYLLQTDYSYSQSDTNDLLKRLKGLGINKDAPLIEETQTTQGREGEEEVSVFDEIEDVQQTRAMEKIEGDVDVEEDLYPDEKIPVDRYITTLKNLMEQVGDSRKLFNIRIKIKGDKQLITDIYGEEGWKSIIEIAPEEESNYKQTITRRKTAINKKTQTLTDSEQKLMNVDTSNFTPNQYEEYIKQLDDIKLKYVAKTKSVVKKPSIKKEKIVEEKTTEPIKEEKVQKERVKEESVVVVEKQSEVDKILERETMSDEEKQKAREQKIPDSKIEITSDILDKKQTLKSFMINAKLSDYQGDTTTKEYIAAESKTIEENINFFENITSDELQPLLQSLAIELDDAQSAAAGVLLKRYAYNNRYSQFKDIAEYIKELNRIQTSTAASEMGGMSQIYGKGHIKAAVSDVSIQTKTKMQLPPKMLLNALDNEYNTVDEYRAFIESELNDLAQQHKQTKDKYDKYVIKEKMKELQRILDAIDSDDFAGAIDAILSQLENKEENKQENQQKMSDISKMVVEWLLTESEASKKISGGKKISALSPKAKEKLMNFWSGLTTFRYLAMLSSPKTAAKNATSNTLVCCKAILDDFISGKFEKSNILSQESQVKFKGDFDTDFANYVDKNYRQYVLSQVDGDKYYGTEINKIKADYAKSKNPLLKKAAFAKLDALERKMLQDKPWTLRRAMRNIKNTLAGSTDAMMIECNEWLSAKYGGLLTKTKIKDESGKTKYIQKTIQRDINKGQITTQELAENIRKTNPELADLYMNAISGDPLSVLKLSEKLKISLLNKDNPKNIIDFAIYRGNELLFKTDNWYTEMRKNLSIKHPSATIVLDLIFPFMRTTVNTSSYILNNSPIGIIKGVYKLLQTKQMYRADMVELIDNYYRQQFNNMKNAEIENYKFKESEYREWYEDNIFSSIQSTLNSGNYKEISTLFDTFVEDGKIAKGLVGRNDPYARALAFERLSQGLTGTSFLVIGAILAAVTNAFDYDDDEDYLGPIIRIGDFKIPLTDLSPFTTMFTMGAMLTSSDKWSDNISRALKVFADQSLFSIMDSAIAYSTDVWDFAGNQLTNIFQSFFIPSILRNITKVIDNSKKDKSGNWGMNFLKTTASNIPGLSYLVPNKINPYTGETEKYYEGGIFEALINQVSPISFRIDSKSDFEKMAEKYKAETTGLSGRFTINTKDYTVTNKQKENLSKFRADYLQDEFEKITSGKQKVTVEDENGKRITTTWNKLSDSQKSKVLKNLYSKSTEVSKIKHWIHNLNNQYVVTDRDLYNTYKKLFGSTQGLVYKQSWSKSKFIER